MGRARKSAEGWQLRKQPNSPFWFVRFRHKGRRHEKSTRETDKAKARARAAEIYAETVSGRAVVRAPSGAGSLVDALTDWLDVYADEHREGTTDTVAGYAEAHWVPFFRDAEHFTTATVDDYRRARLQKVTRSSVRKELSGLRIFAEWWGAHGGPVVEVPPLPKQGLPGTRHKNARKPKAIILKPAEVERMIHELPERNKLGAPVRDMVRVLWETGLRESTVFELRTPEHFEPGRAELLVTRDIDKTAESGERRLDITAACRHALERAAPPEGGLIFRRFSLREPIAAACTAAELRVISPYDLRHSRLSAWANAGGPIAGVQYLAGHKHVSTTARYIQASREAARAVLRSAKKGCRTR